jgi:hypothetical protein
MLDILDLSDAHRQAHEVDVKSREVELEAQPTRDH